MGSLQNLGLLVSFIQRIGTLVNGYNNQAKGKLEQYVQEVVARGVNAGIEKQRRGIS